MKTVYLAGPISGVSYNGCTEWREGVRRAFAPGILGLSPMRAKDYLAELGTIPDAANSDYQVEHPMVKVLSSSRGIMSRDYYDCTHADMVLANLLGATSVSIGTVMEMAWCFGHRVPLVVAIEPENNLHEHPMVREAISFRVPTLEQAVHVVNAVLGDYVNDPNGLARVRRLLELEPVID